MSSKCRQIIILLGCCIVVISSAQMTLVPSVAAVQPPHQSQRLEIVTSANQTDKRRSLGLGDLSYSYAATDIDSPHGSHIKTITVIKNVKLPKHTSSGDKDYKPDEWVKHVDTQFKMVLKVPEFPDIPAFNYLPIDVGHKKPPVVATVAPPLVEETEKPKEEEVKPEMPKEETEPETKGGEKEAGSEPDVAVSSESGVTKIEGEAENVVPDNEGNLEITDDAEHQSQHDMEHIYKISHPNYNRHHYQYVEELPQAMSLIKTPEQIDSSKLERPIAAGRLPTKHNSAFSGAGRVEDSSSSSLTPSSASSNTDQSDIDFIGSHAIRAQDAVRSQVAQAEWNRVRQPEAHRQDTKNRVQSVTSKVRSHPIRINENGQSKAPKSAIILEDFSEYSMHNVKHIMGPSQKRNKHSDMRYKADFNSATPNPMPHPLSHQTQQTLNLEVIDKEQVQYQDEAYAKYLKHGSSTRTEKHQLRAHSGVRDKEPLQDESSQWSAYSDSDKSVEPASNLDSEHNQHVFEDSNSRQLSELNQFTNYNRFKSSDQSRDNPTYNSIDLQKLPSIKSPQSEPSYTNEHYHSHSEHENKPRISFSQSNIRSSDEFVSYESTRQVIIPESTQTLKKAEYSQQTDNFEKLQNTDIPSDVDHTKFGEYKLTNSDQRNPSGHISTYTDEVNLNRETQITNNQNEDNPRVKYTATKNASQRLKHKKPRLLDQMNVKQSDINEPEAHSNNAAYKVTQSPFRNSSFIDSSQYQAYQPPNHDPKQKPYSAPSIQKAYSTSSTTTQRIPYMAPIKSRAPMQFYILHAQTTSTQRPYLSPSVYKSYSLNQGKAKLEQQKLDVERDLLEQQQQDEERMQLRQKQTGRSQSLRDEEIEEQPRAEQLQLSRDQRLQETDTSTSAPHFDQLRFFDSGGKLPKIPQDVEVFSELTPIKSQSYRSATHDELRITSPRPRTSTTTQSSAEIQLHFPPQHVAKDTNGASSHHRRPRPTFVAVPLDISTTSPFVRDPNLGPHKVPPHLVRHPLVFDSKPPHSFLESPFRLSRKPK